MASLVLLNVPQTLIDQIKEWARQRRVNADDAAIDLLKMAVESTPPPKNYLIETKKEIGN